MGEHRRTAERGTSLVEFALMTPLTVLLILALFDIGRAVYYYNSLSHLARDGARAAIVHNYSGAASGWGADGTRPGTYTGTSSVEDGSVVDRIVDGLVALDPAQLTITIEAQDHLPYMNFPVTVRLQYPYTPVSSMLIGGVTLTLAAESTMLIE